MAGIRKSLLARCRSAEGAALCPSDMMLCVIPYWVLSGAKRRQIQQLRCCVLPAKMLKRRDVYLKLTRHNGRAGTHGTYAAHRLDDVLNKFLKTMQTTATRLQDKLLKPEVRQKGKEQVKEKARDSVLQLLNRLQAEQIQRKPSVPPVAEKSETRGDVY